MGTHKKSKSRPFVMVFKDMMKSEAWEELTNASRVAYLHLKSKCISSDQDEVTLSFKEMERFMDRHTYSRSLTQLKECGFIDIVQKGGLYRKRNYYRFTFGWKDYKKKTGARKAQVCISTPSTVCISTPSGMQ